MPSKHLKIILSVVFLLSACGEKRETAVKIDLPSIEEKNQKVSGDLISSDWKSLSSLFSSDAKNKGRKTLSRAWQEAGVSACSLLKSEQVKEKDRTAGYLTFQCAEGKELAVIDYNNALQITSLVYEKLPDEKQIESSSAYTEQLITIGRGPCMQGILTMPVNADYPPVAILMPEGAADEMDASGSDKTFRRDLAHALASVGIASVRYDMRAYEDPVVLRPSLLSFDRLYGYDFAWCVHHLEKFHVDASTILYIGHGTMGSLGYKFVQDHFEIDGGMVLLNARFETGLQLMSDVFSVTKEDISSAEEAVSSETDDSEQYIGMYPLSFYKEWMQADPLNHTRYVSIPIAILQGKKDDIATMSDFEKWKSQKGSNVSMKSYPELSHFLRESDGSISQVVIDDIYQWLNGENIEKVDEMEENDES